MRFTHPVPVTEMASMVDARIIGDDASFVTGINEIHKVETGDIVFVDHPKYYDKCINSAASFILINKEIEAPSGKTLLLVTQPFEAYATIVRHFRPFVPATSMIGDSAVIDPTSIIFPGVFIGSQVTIGKNCIIYPNTTILEHTQIGDNVIIQSGTVIGSNAFYYNGKKEREVWYKKMPDCGRVVIEDDVEIGASCTIDRGVSHDTRIGRGTKLDNMVHIGHDTVIGPNCLIAAQVGIAGATTLEEGVTLWGQVGVNKTITIKKGAVVLGQSGVVADIEGNNVYFGTPALEAGIKRRELVWTKRIPELWRKVMGE